jgi:hypothetical protein
LLPSEFQEVQAYPELKRLLAEHVDMQFKDLQTMLLLPLPPLSGGCNFAMTAVLLNIVAGVSALFYVPQKGGTTVRARTSGKTKRPRGAEARFTSLLRDFYPWADEPLRAGRGSKLLYEATRNPLDHSLGLADPPATGHAVREVRLAKSALTGQQIEELETSAARPSWTGTTITLTPTLRKDRIDIRVATPYWGVHRMLHSLFGNATQAASANQRATQFGPLWDKYVSLGEKASISDCDGVKGELQSPSHGTNQRSADDS